MQLADLESRICQAVVDLQKLYSRDVTTITLDTRPVGDLDDFDSANGLELTAALAMDYGVDVPLDENIFLDERDRPLTIQQIAKRLNKLIPEK